MSACESLDMPHSEAGALEPGDVVLLLGAERTVAGKDACDAWTVTLSFEDGPPLRVSVDEALPLVSSARDSAALVQAARAADTAIAIVDGQL